MCIFKLPDVENILPHNLHENGFSPGCVLMCLVKLLDVVNTLPHSLHENALFSVRVLSCVGNVHLLDSSDILTCKYFVTFTRQELCPLNPMFMVQNTIASFKPDRLFSDTYVPTVSVNDYIFSYTFFAKRQTSQSYPQIVLLFASFQQVLNISL